MMQDKVINILKGNPKAKRAKRKAQVEITLYDLGTDGVSVQVNGKEVWLAPSMERAEEDAKHRKERAEALGRTVSIDKF
jgi:hypothetical protein